MFRSNTLFVLGAGSSYEVGLPTGETLKNQIAEKLNYRFQDGYKLMSGDSQIMQAFKLLGRSRLDLSSSVYFEKSSQLKEGLPLAISIDNLLDAHRDDELAAVCGKLGIVKCIQEAEQNSKLYINRNFSQKIDFQSLGGTWFTEFLKVLTEGIPKAEINNIFSNVSFINFNYDRCVEHFIFHAIKNYYSLSLSETQDVLELLKIIHPYGQIGKLPW